MKLTKSKLKQIIREEIQLLNEADWTVIKTGEKTLNKKVWAQVKKMFPNMKPKKQHVPGVGYVYYFKNAKGDNIGMVSIQKPGGVEIRIRK